MLRLLSPCKRCIELIGRSISSRRRDRQAMNFPTQASIFLTIVNDFDPKNQVSATYSSGWLILQHGSLKSYTAPARSARLVGREQQLRAAIYG